MASDVRAGASWAKSSVRFLMWGVAAFLLALPAAAMRFTEEVNWSLADFAVMGALVAAAVGGALLARGRPAGMALATGAAAIAQMVAHVIAFAGKLGAEELRRDTAATICLSCR